MDDNDEDSDESCKESLLIVIDDSMRIRMLMMMNMMLIMMIMAMRMIMTMTFTFARVAFSFVVEDIWIPSHSPARLSVVIVLIVIIYGVFLSMSECNEGGDEGGDEDDDEAPP